MKKPLMMVLVSLMMMVFAGVALAGNETGVNTYFGLEAGNSGGGLGNSSFGYQAGHSLTTGSYANNFMGRDAGYSNTEGIQNTFMGDQAGFSNINGHGNTYIGAVAGYTSTGSFNVFLGYMAGRFETGSQKLYIANSDTFTPLIYGDFSSNILSTPGYLGIGTKTPVRQLHLVGDNAVFRMDRTMDTAAFLMVRTDGSGTPQQTFVVGTNYDATNGGSFVINDLGSAVSGGGTNRLKIDKNGTVTVKSLVQTSSIASKNNVRTYENALETVNKLRGVRFDWKDSGQPSVGLIAEEVEKVVPEVVAHNDGNVTGVNYASLVGVLVEAVKELKTENENLKKRLLVLEEK